MHPRHAFKRSANNICRDTRRDFITVLAIGLALLLPLAAQAGDGSPAPISNTEGSSRVVALAAAESHTCALKADGSAACWGKDIFGNAPASVSGPFISLTAGQSHTCGLKANGSAACWGNNRSGQAPASVAGPFVALTTRSVHTCGLKADGSAACWGDNRDGQAPASVPGPFVALIAGAYHTCGLKADGSASCWGLNYSGQAPASVAGPFVALTAGIVHTCGMKADGSAVCWGNNGNGRSTPPSGPFIAMTSGNGHNCALKADGSAACWGFNLYGQATPPAGSFIALAAGRNHTCGLKPNGSVECWGAGGPGTTGYPNDGQSTVPTNLGPLGFGQIAAGNAHACQVNRDGTLSCWGNDDQGQATPPAGVFTQVVTGDSQSCAIGANGKVSCWGQNAASNQAFFEYVGLFRQLAADFKEGVCGLSSTPNSSGLTFPAGMPWCSDGVGFNEFPSARYITSGYGTYSLGVCAVNADGSGGCERSNIPNPPANSWQRLESGLNHQCGLTAEGTLDCWGTSDEGQTDSVPIGMFRSLSVGYNHGCAIREDGELACWGSDLNGQTDAPAGNYVQVAAGNTFSCAIRNDGERVCWGAAPGNPAALSDLPDGRINVAFSQQLTVTGPSAPTTPVFVLMSGSVPPGLSLDANGLVSGTPITMGTSTFTIDAEGDDGFATTRTYTVTIADGSPPEISFTLTPPTPDGDNGWYVSDVSISWTVIDAETAISSSTGCDAATLASDTLDATYTCSATSTGGTSSITSDGIKRDATAPTISASATTLPDANGWYSGDVTVHFTCADATSGVVSCPADEVLTGQGAGVSSTAKAIQDMAGNSATSNVVTVNIDRTAPVISYTLAPPAPDGDNGWYVSDVGIDWTVADPESDITAPTGCDAATLASDTLGATYTCSATSTGGTSSVTTDSIKRDATKPTLAPTVPSLQLRGGSYAASANASDALSGLASSSCGPLDTTSTGNKTVTCTASDNAGNIGTVAVDYTVTTTCFNDGYSGAKLIWCKQICESGLTGQKLDFLIRLWVYKYRDLPYCRVGH